VIYALHAAKYVDSHAVSSRYSIDLHRSERRRKIGRKSVDERPKGRRNRRETVCKRHSTETRTNGVVKKGPASSKVDNGDGTHANQWPSQCCTTILVKVMIDHLVRTDCEHENRARVINDRLDSSTAQPNRLQCVLCRISDCSLIRDDTSFDNFFFFIPVNNHVPSMT
jgi:hypothetical protein